MNGADDMIWDTLKHSFCRFRVKQKQITQDVMCREHHNLTGYCSKKVCPLANSQYATVRELEGKVFLFVKTVERAHLPAKLWDKVELSTNLKEAMSQIDENLQWWPRHIIFKCKARILRIKEYLRRMRRIRLKPQPKLVHIKKKEEKQLKNRERKALRMAKLDETIEKELLNRLRSGVYDPQIPVNIPDAAFMAVIDKELDREEEKERAKKGLPEVEVPEIDGEIYEAATDEEDELELEDEDVVSSLEGASDRDSDYEDGLDGLSEVSGSDDEGDDGGADKGDKKDKKDAGAGIKKRPHMALGASSSSSSSKPTKKAAPPKKKSRKEYEIEREQESIKSLIDW